MCWSEALHRTPEPAGAQCVWLVLRDGLQPFLSMSLVLSLSGLPYRPQLAKISVLMVSAREVSVTLWRIMWRMGGVSRR